MIQRERILNANQRHTAINAMHLSQRSIICARPVQHKVTPMQFLDQPAKAANPTLIVFIITIIAAHSTYMEMFQIG